MIPSHTSIVASILTARGVAQTPGKPARYKVRQLGVQSAHRLGVQAGQVLVTVGQHPQDGPEIIGVPPPRSRRPRSAAMAVDRASLGSFLFDFPDPSTRTRADSVGGTSTTSSPAATSCWASR